MLIDQNVVAEQGTEANKDPIRALQLAGVKNLSAESGSLQIAIAEHKDKMAYLSDHTLYVLGTHERDLDVLSYKELIRYEGFEILQEHSVSISFLKQLYANLDGNVRAITKSSQFNRVETDELSSVQSAVIKLIIAAVERQASDIHITVFEKMGTVAIRTHGDLYLYAEYSAKTCLEYCTAIYNSMTDLSDTQYKPGVSQDARMGRKYVEQCKLFGARIASGPTDSGSRMVIRLLYDSGAVIPTLEQLGYLPEHITMIESMRRLTSGVQIVSGATGSGKSTTLSAILSSIIRDAKQRGTALVNNGVEQFLGLSVVTIEDPPEYKIEGAIQTPLITDKSDENEVRIAWARSIAAIVRQDPDVIMVGEVRDQGSAKTTFDAALTGHSVWTTVHTTDAVGIMMRIDGLGVEPDRMLDPEIVTGLINQSLAQKLCPHCSIPWNDALKTRDIEPGLRNRVESYCVTEGVRLRGKGCRYCKGFGIIGRMVVAEVILPNLEFMEVFKEKGKAHAKRHWIVEMGGITKGMALIRRINQGFIDPSEGERSVAPLDRDKEVLGVDYSINGQFPKLRALTLPDAGHDAEFVGVVVRDQRGSPQPAHLVPSMPQVNESLHHEDGQTHNSVSSIEAEVEDEDRELLYD